MNLCLLIVRLSAVSAGFRVACAAEAGAAAEGVARQVSLFQAELFDPAGDVVAEGLEGS